MSMVSKTVLAYCDTSQLIMRKLQPVQPQPCKALALHNPALEIFATEARKSEIDTRSRQTTSLSGKAVLERRGWSLAQNDWCIT